MPDDMSGWTYQERYVRCGKASCKRCSLNGGHGPYWYGYIHRDGRMYTRYFGKQHPQGDPGAATWRNYSRSAVQEGRRDETFAKKLDPRWERPKRMDAVAAMRILGFTLYPLQTVLHRRYRELANEHHPDHGGDNRIMVAVNLAYAYLQKN